jgi:hypothetical protein
VASLRSALWIVSYHDTLVISMGVIAYVHHIARREYLILSDVYYSWYSQIYRSHFKSYGKFQIRNSDIFRTYISHITTNETQFQNSFS